MTKTAWKTSFEEGHYSQKLIFPKVLALLGHVDSVLDVGCGQGLLAKILPPHCRYVGIDASKALIKHAKTAKNHTFLCQDASLPFSIDPVQCATLILSLQNMERPAEVLKQIASSLHPSGKLIIVLNHPCFRIPRQSSWGVDPKSDIQYRRLDRYFTPLEIPIQMHPGKNEEKTISFHFSLSAYSKMLHESGFVIESIEEWISDKISVGKASKKENRARQEFPLFMAIVARKL